MPEQPQQHPTVPQAPYGLANWPTEDEISLIDLWNVLSRRKSILWTVFVAVLVAAGIYVFVAPRVYEGRAVIEVGQVGDDRLLVEPERFRRRLEEGYISEGTRVKETETARLESIESKEGVPENLVLTVRGAAAAQVQQHLQRIIDGILASHQDRFQTLRGEVERKLEMYERHAKVLDTALGELEAGLDWTREAEPAAAATLLVERTSLLQKIPSIQDKVLGLERALSGTHSYPTRVIVPPDLAQGGKPIKPRSMLVMVLAVVLGLIVGIFSAFGAEFMAKVRATNRQGENGTTPGG